MVSTYLGYQLITRDLDKAIGRVEKQTTVQRDTDYFEKNIGKVSSIDDFLKNDRLYRYAMKAFGLEDMTYAKAFMKKALEGGVSSSDSFANKLTDKRYAAFVSAFNFSSRAERTTTYAEAQQGVTDRYNVLAFTNGVALDDPTLLKQNADYTAAVAKVTSVDEFLANDAVYNYAMKAFDLGSTGADKAFMRDILEGGVSDPNSLANQQKNTNFAKFAAAFDFAGKGEKATTWRAAVEGTAEKFARQKLEEDAGDQNEGVRLALNFQRKAKTITSWYDVLADTALAKVVRTTLGLPDSFASADLDRQVSLFKAKLDIKDFQDGAKLDKFMKRFTSMYDVANASTDSSAASPVALFQSTASGISTDLMLTMQQLKF
ncbi:MAG: DUF1217 domain-containing protein [Methylobacterium mesophilicum]|nr:DUF1217 domain-containing protein [Methylobacterium mesophilicum]